MDNYKLVKNENNEITCVIKNNTLAIPISLGNTDYQEYLKWLEEGNTPLPADDPS